MSKKLTTEEFICRAREVHGDKYDYSKAIYVSNNQKICIICPIHGEFWQRAADHMRGCGCNNCRIISNTDNFIQKARMVHGDKYDYSKANYKGKKIKVCIICPIHGEFWQNAGDHLSGKGCIKCAYERTTMKNSLNTKEFIQRAIKVHHNSYDYSLVYYTNNHEKIDIICPTHGVFSQTPNNHLNGQGCPRCYHSKGETAVKFFLDKYAIPYISQYKVINKLTLFGNGESFRVDFYLPKQNIIIEFNGIQHYKEVKHFHKKNKGFERQKERDKKLKKWCEDNGIKLLIIKYTQINEIEEILKQQLNFYEYERN